MKFDTEWFAICLWYPISRHWPIARCWHATLLD